MRIRIPLTAGQSARQWFKASCVVIASTGAAPSVDLSLFGADQQDVEGFGQCERMFSIYDASRVFSGVELTAAVDCVVELIISRSRVEVMDGATVTATIDAAQLPLPVQNGQGDAPGNPLFVSGLAFNDTPAASATNNAGVAVTDTGAVVKAADATRLALRFRNIGNDPVAIGPAGVTWANRTLVLGPDDFWEERGGAVLAWSAITNTGATATVTVQELKA